MASSIPKTRRRANSSENVVGNLATKESSSEEGAAQVAGARETHCYSYAIDPGFARGIFDNGGESARVAKLLQHLRQ